MLLTKRQFTQESIRLENSAALDLAKKESEDIGPHKAHLNKLRYKTGSSLRKWYRLFPLTWSGLLTLVAGVLGWCTLGSRHRDLVISAASFILGLLVIILMLCVLINALRLHLRLRREEQDLGTLKLETGYPRTTDYQLNLSYFPFTEISWVWTYPVQVDVSTSSTFKNVKETVTARHRCQADHITRHFIVRDILGLARMEWERTFPTAVTIIPKQENFSANQVLPSVSDGDEDSNPYGAPKGDRIEMRKYSTGDSSRDIIWKIYARTRKLMVRVPERAITAQPRSCAYLIGAHGDDSSASLARTILERHMLGDNWGFGADGTPGVITNLSQAVQAIAQSGNYALGSAAEAKITNLSAFLRDAEAQGYNNCLIFIPSRLEPPPSVVTRWQRWLYPAESTWPDWTKPARQALNSCHMTITWLMGVEKDPRHLAPAEEPQLPPWRQKLLHYTLAPKHTETDTSAEVTKALVGENTPVWLYASDNNRFLVYNSIADANSR